MVPHRARGRQLRGAIARRALSRTVRDGIDGYSKRSRKIRWDSAFGPDSNASTSAERPSSVRSRAALVDVLRREKRRFARNREIRRLHVSTRREKHGVRSAEMLASRRENKAVPCIAKALDCQ